LAVENTDGPIEVSARGGAGAAASTEVTAPIRLCPALFGKRAITFALHPAEHAVLNRPLVDSDTGFGLMPMRGNTLTTGGRVCPAVARRVRAVLERAEPVARALLRWIAAVDQVPWMGVVR